MRPTEPTPRNPFSVLERCRALAEIVERTQETERTARRVFGNSHPTVLDIGKDLKASREALARLGEDSDKAVMMALAFVAALAFLAGRRYLRR